MRLAALYCVAALAFFARASPASAQDEPRSGFFIAPQASTLGLGFEAGYRPTAYLAARFNANFFGLGRDVTIDGVRYHVDMRAQSFGFLADLHPFGGSFRLTGGFRINDNRGDLSASPTNSATIGKRVFTLAELGGLDGRVEFNQVAPYVGFGWATTLFSPNVYLGADFGVMFQGKPNVSLTTSGRLSSPQFAAHIEQQRLAIEDRAKDYRFYPVVTVSIGYRF